MIFFIRIARTVCRNYLMVYYSFKYVHVTCIVTFIYFFIMGNNKCTALLSSSPCSMFLMCLFKQVLLAEQINE